MTPEQIKSNLKWISGRKKALKSLPPTTINIIKISSEGLLVLNFSPKLDLPPYMLEDLKVKGSKASV